MIYNKLFFLLNKSQKKELFLLLILLIVGIFFEMIGLGILIPALTLMLDSNIGETYPQLEPFLNYIGNPSQFKLVLLGMSTVVLVYLIKAIFLIFISWKQSKFTANLTEDLSRNLFLGYLRQPYSFHIERNSAELLRNIQIEVGQLTQAAQGVLTISVESSMIFGVILTLILIEPIGALSVIIFFSFFGWLFYKLIKNKLNSWGFQRSNHSKYLNKHLLQGLSGIKDIIINDRQSFFSNEFNKHNLKYANLTAKVALFRLIPRFYLELLAVIGLSIFLIIIVFQNYSLNTIIPVIGVFVAAAFRLLPSVNRIISGLQIVQFVKPVVEILYKEFLLISKSENKAYFNKNNDTQSSFKRLELKNILFKYENSNSFAIENISIEINNGETIGFIGKSGSGKSTLVDIILGILIPNKGKIFFNNKSIENVLNSWKNKVGYVPQSIYLIDDSLKNNIAFGIPKDKINKNLLNKAVRDSQLNELINELPNGLDTIVGERGIKLSGGQRQRIGIARALYYNPELLVLDEATSSLDIQTEKEFMKAVDSLRGKKTIIIIAHRYSTLTNCSYIYKLKNGKIVSKDIPSKILK